MQRLTGTLLAALWLWAMPVASDAAVKVERMKVRGVSGLVADDAHVPAFDVTLVLQGAGSASDPVGKEGLARAAAAMLMEGAGDYGDDAFHQMLESHAIEMSAAASEDALTIHFKSLSEQADVAFDLLAAVLAHPRLESGQLEQVKQRMLVAVRRMKESPVQQAQQAWNMLAFGDHPYGRLPLGSQASIEAITSEDVKQWLTQHLGKDQLLFAVAGDVSSLGLKDRLSKLFATLPDEAPGAMVAPPITLVASGKEVEVTMDVPQAVVVFGRQGVARSDPNFYAAYLLNQVVGGMSLTSRLGHEMREKRGLTYGVDTALEAMQSAQLWVGSFATRADRLEEAQRVFEETLRAVAEHGVSEQEFEQAKQYVLGSFPLGLDSNEALSGYLVGMQLYHLGDDYLEKRNQYFQAVTLADVNRLAASMFDPDRLIIARVGPRGVPQTKSEDKPIKATAPEAIER